MRKTIIKILTLCAVVGAFLGAMFLSVPVSAKAESEISVTADFTRTSIVAAKQMGFEIDNLATDSEGHAVYGAVPGAAWGAIVSGGNATVVYELNVGDGYVIKNGRLSFEIGVGHAGGLYWYNVSNTLGANLKIYVSTNKLAWTEVFDLDEASNHKIRSNENASSENGRYSNENEPISLNDYFSRSRKCYVKFDILHFDLEKAKEAQPAVSDWTEGIPLGKIGLCLYKINVSAEKEENDGANVVQITNDFTKSGAVSSFQGVTDYDKLVRDNNGNLTYPLVPAETWGATVNIRTGEIIYKLSADEGYVFGNTTLKLTFACFAAKEEFKGGNSDLLVQVSRDYVFWEKIYSSYETRGVSQTSAWISDSLSLDDYGGGMGVLYVKIILKCPEVDGVMLHQVPVLLKEVSLSATQEEPADSTIVPLKFGNKYGGDLTSGYPAITESSGLYDGTSECGLLPADSDSGNVVADNGYFVYRLTAPENKMFKNARFLMEYKLLSSANVRIQYSVDGASYFDFFNAVEHRGRIVYKNDYIHNNVAYQILDVNLYSVVRNKSVVYLKIFVDHPTGTYSVKDLKAEIFGINVQSTFADFFAVSNITYYLNGGNYENGEDNPTEYTSSTPEIVLKNPVKKYYDFKGWFDNAEFNGNAVTVINTVEAKDWQLYAKFERGTSAINVIVIGEGVLKDGDNNAITETSVQVLSGENYTIKLEPANGWLIYSLKVSSVEVLLKNDEYVIGYIDGDFDVVATFAKKQTTAGDFSVDYRDCIKYGNEWKKGLYDFDNLYITDDSFHALGNDNGIGYIVYKFVPNDKDLIFEAASLVTVSKPNDYLGMQTNERIDYYVGYDGENYELIYETPLSRSTKVVSTTQNLSEYVYDKTEFYLKIVIGSNSANWTLLYSLDIEFTYRTVELTVDYGDYTDVLYTQYKNKVLDTSLIVPRKGYVLTSKTVYADSERTNEFDLTKPVTEDTTIYMSAERESVGNVIAYVLNGGENSEFNSAEYSSEQTTILYPATREGYLFGGWYFDASLTLRATEITAGRFGKVTLYAKWIEDSVPDDIPINWDITYVLNGGENSAANFSTYRTGTGVELQAAAREGYVFDGWYSDSEFKNKIERIDEKTVGHITLYAKWISKEPQKSETTKIPSCTIAVVITGITLGVAMVGVSLMFLLKKRRKK